VPVKLLLVVVCWVVALPILALFASALTVWHKAIGNGPYAKAGAGTLKEFTGISDLV